MLERLGRRGSIYIFCPAAIATGGPEALHQLYDALRQRGHSVRMVYYPTGGSVRGSAGRIVRFPDIEDKVAEPFQVYRPEHTIEIVDSPETIIVIPEPIIGLAPVFRLARVFIWWLSVDNALAEIERIGGMARIAQMPAVHLVQSNYAEDVLRRHGINAFRLYDYLSASLQSLANRKQDRILYNPAKGLEETRRLMAAAPDLAWQPLAGLDRRALSDLLSNSKVYVDFGPHPGKDRLPREAAALGCCVVTGRRGSADFFHDMPIPAEYKFADPLDPAAVVACLRRCLDDYWQRLDDFSYYRRCIAEERDEFLAQVRRIFG